MEKYLADSQNIMKTTTEDLLLHLKEETKRRIRDRNDSNGKFDLMSEKINKIYESGQKTNENLESMVKVVRSFLSKP